MSIYSDLRRRHPYLTPPFVGEDEQVAPRRPAIRVAFGDRGLTGVEDPQQQPQITTPQQSEVPRPPESIANPAATRPYRVGINVAGLKGADRGLAELEMMREKPLGSQIEDRGDTIGYGVPKAPPHGFKARLKAMGKGALIGLGAGGPGGAVAGAITGGVSPVTIDKMLAQRALQRKTAEVGQQIDIEKGRAQLEDLRMRPAIEAAKIQAEADYRHAQQDIQRQLEEGRISRAEAQRQLEEIKATETARHNRELERLGQARIDKSPTAQPDRVGARQEAARQRKYTAATNEVASLIKQEEAARQAKDAAYTEFGNLQDRYSKATDPSERARLGPLVKASEAKAKKAQDFYAGFGAKKTAAQKAIDENAPAAQPSYSGRTMTKANLARYAKDHGLTEDEARKQIEGMGVTIR